MRYRKYLIARYQLILRYLASLLVLIGVLNLLPLVTILFYPEEAIHLNAFLFTALPLIVIGLLGWRFIRPHEEYTLTLQDDYIIVCLTWLVAIVASVFPMMQAADLNFSQAWFEATSGLTTTGLTVIDVSQTPRIVLFHRSILQLVGGAGFAIIALSALAGIGNASLSVAEGRTDQLAPHVRQSAVIVLRMYFAYIIAGLLALRLAGMGWFDAINHAFASIATGGFSTQTDSIGHWDNPLIEGIIIVLMLIGTTNFLLSYLLIRGKLGVVARSGEVRIMAISLAFAFATLLLIITLPTYTALDTSLRVALFETVSAGTSTGFTLTTYADWQGYGWLVLIVLMLMGGGSGSTSGGFKYLRVYILYKAIIWEVKRAFMPAHMVNQPAVWQGQNREILTDRQIRQVALYGGLFFASFFVGSAIFMAHGYDFQQSIFEYASTLATAGLSVGITQPDMPLTLLWLQSITMLLGRLEFFAVIIGILHIVDDLRHIVKSV